MKATLVHVREPFRPHVGRQVHRLSRRTRIDTLLRKHGLIAGRGRNMRRLSHFVVAVGPNEYLLEKQWKRCVSDGEVLAFVAIPAGGGSVRMIAMAVVAAAAIWFSAGYAAPYVGTWAGAGTVGAAFGGVAISVAGSLLINAVLPLPKAALGSSDNTSTNYGIAPSANTARLGEPIPVQYGRFNVTPNYAAQPYTEYDGSNQQTLFSLLCITQGSLAIEAIRIGDTPIDNFAEVKYEVIEPGGTVTLFPDNVVTSDAVAGIELKAPGDGGDWAGPFVTNPAGTTTTQLAFDLGYPQGLYRLNKDGKDRTANSPWIVQVQKIDDSGNPIGAWVTLEQANDWLDDKTPGIYTTHRYTVAAGRYQARARKLAPASMDGTVVNTLYWMGLRAYLPSHRTYGDVTLLAVQIRATNNLNGATAKSINVTGTRKLPIWNGASWSAPVATRSIAWAAADVLRNATYGRGWADNRINLEELRQLDAVWSARGDEFNGVFDTRTTLWDALTTVVRCGRALPMYYAGVVEIIRDQPQTLNKLTVVPDNITQGGFSTQYNFPTPDTPDYVVVTYTDPDTWKPATVDCALTGSLKQTPKNVTMMGCTSRDQAFREGMYMAADNRDRRNLTTLALELDGNIPRYGDLISVSHDTPAWGLSGTVADYDADSQVLTLTEPVQWWPDQNHYVLLRNRNGSGNGPYRVIAGADAFHVVLQGLTPEQKASIYVSDGVTEEPTVYQFGPGTQYAKPFLVTAARPDQSGHVQLTLANYAESVYTAESDASVPPPPSGSLLINPPDAPAVGGISLTQDPDSQTVRLSVQPVPGAVAYEFQVSYDGGVTWLAVGISTINSIVARIPAGEWIVRARAISAMGVSGGWNQTPITVTGDPPAIGALLNLTATGGLFSVLLAWQLPDRLNLIGADATELWFGPTSNRAQAQRLAAVSLPSNTYTLSNLPAGVGYYFWARVRGTDSGNYGPEVGPVYGESSTDVSMILDAISGQIDESLLGQELQDKIAGIDVNAETIIKQSLAQYETNNETRSSRAYIARLDETKATAEEAEAIAQQTVGAQIGDLSALVQDTAEVYVDNNGNAHAFNLTKVGVTKDGQYIAAGLAVGVETVGGVPQSQILLQASRVAVVDDVNGTLKAFFVVQAGQTFIQSAFIADGSITNAKIGNVIQSTNYDGVNGWQINKNGTAYFGGDVKINGNITATSVTGAFQTNMTAAWNGPVFGNSEGATDAFALGAPVRDGENHTPVVQAELTLEGTHSSETCNSYVRLERSTNGGSTWALVREVFYSLKSVSTQTYYFQSVDTPTEDAVQYRFKLRAGDRNPGSFQLDAVNVFIFGLR